MVIDKLKIVLITYNRAESFASTLEQIFSENSPIKDFDITILNNASTDGTDEIILKYQEKFSNLKHIRNPINIGGNANICRAYELCAASDKEYGWVICDDDIFDFANWAEVEKCIEEKNDIICVSDYSIPAGKKDNKAYQMFQLGFVPASIFKISNIDDKVIFTMYESTFAMFQQLVPVAKVINENGKIKVLSKPIVFNGMHFENKRKNYSFARGATKALITERKKKSNWILGFSNIITLLDDEELIKECMDASIPYVDIYGSWRNFYRSINKDFFNRKDFNYFLEIYKRLRKRRRIFFWVYKIIHRIPYAENLFAYINSTRIYCIIKLHNLRCGL